MATGGDNDDHASSNIDDLSMLTKVKKSLAHLINAEDEETTTELIRKKVKTKNTFDVRLSLSPLEQVSLCEEWLGAMEVVDPGYSPARGATLEVLLMLLLLLL